MCETATASEPCKSPRPERFASTEAFLRLYRDWHAARAALYDPDLPHGDGDEVGTALDERYAAAELALITTPAPVGWAIWKKWEAFEQLVAADAEDGELLEKRIVLALGSIKADLLRFGIKDSTP